MRESARPNYSARKRRALPLTLRQKHSHQAQVKIYPINLAQLALRKHARLWRASLRLKLASPPGSPPPASSQRERLNARSQQNGFKQSPCHTPRRASGDGRAPLLLVLLRAVRACRRGRCGAPPAARRHQARGRVQRQDGRRALCQRTGRLGGARQRDDQGVVWVVGVGLCVWGRGR